MARILVVEDDQPLRHLVSVRLGAHGHEVRTAEDARAAVRLAVQHQPHLLLFDRKLPDHQDGLDVFRVAKTTLPDLIGIVMTQYGSEEYALQCRHHGVAEYITKPFRMSELTVLVDGVLALHERRGPMPHDLAAELHAAVQLQDGPPHPAPPTGVELLLRALDAAAARAAQEHPGPTQRVLPSVLDTLVGRELSVPVFLACGGILRRLDGLRRELASADARCCAADLRGALERAARLQEPGVSIVRRLHAAGPASRLLREQDLARELGLTRQTVSRAVAATGLTLAEWRAGIRLQAAVRRLVQTDDPIKVVAADTGFGDRWVARQCDRWFNRVFGVDPSQFREVHRRYAASTNLHNNG